MEYAEVKEWLDRHVSHLKEGNELEQFNSQIRAITWNTEVMISSGIELVADTMGLDLKETIMDGVEYPYKYSFVYDGVMFIQLSKERMV